MISSVARITGFQPVDEGSTPSSRTKFKVNMKRYQGTLVSNITGEEVYRAPAIHNTYEEAEFDAAVALLNDTEEVVVSIIEE